MAYGAGLYAFTLFVAPQSAEFGWGRAATGAAVSLFWISAPFSLFTGLLINRFGPRQLIIAGILIEGISFALIGSISSLAELYVLRAVMGLGKIMVAVCLPVIVSYWFLRRYGIALAVAVAGFHLGGFFMAPLTGLLIGATGWRHAAVVLGIGMIVLTVPPVAWVLRAVRPAELGLGPDGPAHDGQPRTTSAQLSVAGIDRDDSPTLRECLQTRNFRLITGGARVSSLLHGTAVLALLAWRGRHSRPARLRFSGEHSTAALLDWCLLSPPPARAPRERLAAGRVCGLYVLVNLRDRIRRHGRSARIRIPHDRKLPRTGSRLGVMTRKVAFAMTCPTCKREQRYAFTLAVLMRLLEGGYPIETYCAVCNRFRPIRAEERVELREVVARACTRGSPSLRPICRAAVGFCTLHRPCRSRHRLKIGHRAHLRG